MQLTGQRAASVNNPRLREPQHITLAVVLATYRQSARQAALAVVAQARVVRLRIPAEPILAAAVLVPPALAAKVVPVLLSPAISALAEARPAAVPYLLPVMLLAGS